MFITDYLDRSAGKFPNKIAFADEQRELDYKTLQFESKTISSFIINENIFKKPIAVFLKKSVECIASFLGAAYSGNFYVPLDTEMPISRIEKIINTLDPALIITDYAHFDEAKSFARNALVANYEDILKTEIDEEKQEIVSSKRLDTDICYILFTSGSTGTPKGVIIAHRSIVDFTEWMSEQFGVDDHYIFGNQTPLYFSFSVVDIYQTLRNGATMYIIPKEKFLLPTPLMEYLHEKRINTLVWVPSALTMISILNALDSPHLDSLENIFFGGEVMPLKQLNKWIKEYPSVRFVNLYGPTEVTDTCTYYEIDREFKDTETLPMGFACKNKDVFLLDENDRITTTGIGEVCVRGTGIAMGYYNDPEKTAAVFVQNPVNTVYPEKIYRTGDLAEINDRGEFVFMGRKDFQIKHMGHRIELGEIETAASSLDGINENCCLYDTDKKRIVLFFTGSMETGDVTKSLTNLVPEYMVPRRIVCLDEMPKNLNGKIDRQLLKERLKEV